MCCEYFFHLRELGFTENGRGQWGHKSVTSDIYGKFENLANAGANTSGREYGAAKAWVMSSLWWDSPNVWILRLEYAMRIRITNKTDGDGMTILFEACKTKRLEHVLTCQST